MRKAQLFHSVFFQLKDSSESATAAFLDDCRTYLSCLPGILLFRTGQIVEEHKREVNMRDFHISLHIVFENKKYHDAYQTAEKHNVFVDRNKDNWGTVRVYDTYIQDSQTIEHHALDL